MQWKVEDRVDQLLDVKTILRVISTVKALVRHLYRHDEYKLLAFQKQDRYIEDFVKKKNR